MPVYYKTVICTEKPVLDVNDNLLRPGKYFFEVTSVDGSNIGGNLIPFNSSSMLHKAF